MSRADSEATAWLDKMMGPDAELHREAFDEWLAKPDNAKAYEEARDNWNWAGDMSTARIAADVRADAREREPGGRRWAFATILAAVIAVGFAWYLVGRDSDQPIIATNSAQGENRLADGTRVTLMDGARIETRFSDGERRVILHDGRARFEVAHDASRPFLVEAGDSVTRALGTIFEVDLRADVAIGEVDRGLDPLPAFRRDTRHLGFELLGLQPVEQRDVLEPAAVIAFEEIAKNMSACLAIGVERDEQDALVRCPNLVLGQADRGPMPVDRT